VRCVYLVARLEGTVVVHQTAIYRMGSRRVVIVELVEGRWRLSRVWIQSRSTCFLQHYVLYVLAAASALLLIGGGLIVDALVLEAHEDGPSRVVPANLHTQQVSVVPAVWPTG
jgi:hypothetical protein